MRAVNPILRADDGFEPLFFTQNLHLLDAGLGIDSVGNDVRGPIEDAPRFQRDTRVVRSRDVIRFTGRRGVRGCEIELSGFEPGRRICTGRCGGPVRLIARWATWPSMDDADSVTTLGPPCGLYLIAHRLGNFGFLGGRVTRLSVQADRLRIGPRNQHPAPPDGSESFNGAREPRPDERTRSSVRAVWRGTWLLTWRFDVEWKNVQLPFRCPRGGGWAAG